MCRRKNSGQRHLTFSALPARVHCELRRFPDFFLNEQVDERIRGNSSFSGHILNLLRQGFVNGVIRYLRADIYGKIRLSGLIPEGI